MPLIDDVVSIGHGVLNMETILILPKASDPDPKLWMRPSRAIESAPDLDPGKCQIWSFSGFVRSGPGRSRTFQKLVRACVVDALGTSPSKAPVEAARNPVVQSGANESFLDCSDPKFGEIRGYYGRHSSKISYISRLSHSLSYLFFGDVPTV